jgi:phage N-6-adenine-methyltransferase
MQLAKVSGSDGLAIPGFFGELTPLGYQARDGMTFEEWKSDGHKLRVVSEGSQWAIGDWWAFGRHSYGDRSRAAASGIFGLSFQGLMDIGSVARNFETSRRREVVPLSFHREVMRLDRDNADQLLDRVEAEKWTRKQLRQAVKKLGANFVPDDDEDGEDEVHNHRAQGTGENEWYTPAQYLDAARELLGGFDLDPATSEAAQARVKAAKWFTKDDDGLAQEWRGKVWLNPPYAQPLIQQFVDKLVEEVEAGNVTEAILLTHNYTDTGWFHTAERAAANICFTRGRIRFEGADGSFAAPTQGQAFFYFGNRGGAFRQAFQQWGFVR